MGWNGNTTRILPMKDEGYLCVVTNEACAQLDLVNQQLAPIFRAGNCKTFFSTELRGGRLIDPCVRCPHPPTSTMLALFSNIPDAIVLAATARRRLTLKNKHKSGAGSIVGSEWAENHWCEVGIPKELRPLVKLQRAYRDESGRYWALPGSPTVCTCVGTGDTPEAACKQAKKVVEGIKVSGGSYNISALDKLLSETVPLGKKNGIPF